MRIFHGCVLAQILFSKSSFDQIIERVEIRSAAFEDSTLCRLDSLVAMHREDISGSQQQLTTSQTQMEGRHLGVGG